MTEAAAFTIGPLKQAWNEPRISIRGKETVYHICLIKLNSPFLQRKMKKISHAVKEGVYPQVSLGLMPISFHVAPAPTGMCSTYTQSQLQKEPPESSHGHPSKQRFLASAPACCTE